MKEPRVALLIETRETTVLDNSYYSYHTDTYIYSGALSGQITGRNDLLPEVISKARQNMDKLCSHWVGQTNLNTCNCSRKATSDYLDKALTSWPTSCPASERGPDVMRPWDDLADWYWQYWNEIETGLTLLRSSDQIPPNPLRDELVGLYFRHVHPLCPIFEEAEFYEKYYLEGDDLAFLQCVSLLEFQSMMFAASLVRYHPTFRVAQYNPLTATQHLNSHQICQTQYTSTFQCHEELFQIAKVRLSGL